MARADFLFKQDTEQSIRSAIRVAPDAWEYYMRLAQFDRSHARELLTKSLDLNRYDAQANIELGLQYEEEGDIGRAEKQLLEAYNVDHTYLPRWSLANFYFRQDNMPEFWKWARSAASMPSDDIGSLFEICWRISPDPTKITAALLNEKPEMIRQYIGFLLSKDQPAEVATIAPMLVRVGDPETDRPVLFSVVNRLSAGNEAGPSTALWRLLMDKHWVVADTSVPNNGQFQREPAPVNFDWSLPEYQGLHSWPGASGLENGVLREPTGRLHDCPAIDRSETRRLHTLVYLSHNRYSARDGSQVADFRCTIKEDSCGIDRSLERCIGSVLRRIHSS